MRNDILFGAILPYLAFLAARQFGLDLVQALALGALFPIAMILGRWFAQRRIAAVSLVVLAATLASLAGSLWLDSAYLALLKGSLITGSVGLAFAVSLLFPRPLVYFLAGGESADKRAEFATIWDRSPPFRALMRFMTKVWAGVLIAEALTRAALIPLLPPAVFVPVSEAMWIAVFAAMTLWSLRYGKRRGAEIRAAAAAH